MIYISTGIFYNLTPQSAILKLSKVGVKFFELSGGKYFQQKKIIRFLKKKNFKYLLHNYFPVPKESFVINLSSNNKEIANKSIANIKKSLAISKQLNSNYFSCHAGFLFDPRIKDLGKKFEKVKLQNRKRSMNLLLSRINFLSQIAKKKNITILIENNVITKENYKKFNQDPFLLTHPQEIIKFFKKCNKNIKLLLDVGHLKVSSKTLGFDLLKGHEMLKPYIEAYHLSDNNGLKDSNNEFTKKAWFFRRLKKNVKYVTIEVYTKNLKKLCKLLSLIEEKYDQ